jgi:hypothetical protein
MPSLSSLSRRSHIRRSERHPISTQQSYFDLRAAVRLPNAPKLQPRWLAAAYGSFVEKEGTNYQIQIGALFRYEGAPSFDVLTPVI